MKMDKAGAAAVHWEIGFEDFKKALEPYTLDYVAKDFKRKSRGELRELQAKTTNFGKSLH